MAKNFIPSVPTQTIGTPTKRWRSIYSTKIRTNDTFINNKLVTFSATVPDVIPAVQYGFTIQNGHIVSFILERYAYDKTLVLRIQSHPAANDTTTVVDYRDIPYSDFTPVSDGLSITNYDLTGMNIPIIRGNYGQVSFVYVTPEGLKGNLLETLANITNVGN